MNLELGKRFTVGVTLSALALLASGAWIAWHGADADAGRASADSSASVAVVDSNFLMEVETHLTAREYWASETTDGLQAPNRRHQLRSHFDSNGVRVHDRTAAGNPRLMSLRMVGLGRGHSLARVDAGELTHDEGRVEITRPALGLTEWFENSEQGLEQGFSLSTRPPGTPSPLVVELEVKGALARLRGESVGLATEAGRKLSYGKLRVVDAEGEALAAHFEVPDSDRIRLVVDDRDAIYPIDVDPLLTGNSDGFIQAGQTEAHLGGSVASAGDVNGDGYDDVIVGARFYDLGEPNEGAAFLFLGSADGIGVENPGTAAARFESNQSSSFLGTSVASAGDVNGDGYSDILIGAPNYGSGGQFGEGAAFLFLGSANGLADGNPNTADAQLESNLNFAKLGFSVASAGDVNGDGYDDVIVGAQEYSSGSGAGAAFVFHGSASGIADGNPTTASTRIVDASQVSILGSSVASAGDVNDDGFDDVVVGAIFYTAGQNREGAAFVYLGSASGIAHGSPTTANARLESNQANAEFGYSVSAAGDVNGDGFGDVVVGARLYANGQSQEGGAFVFLGSAAGVANGNPATAHARLEPNSPGAQGGSGVTSGRVNADAYSDVVVGAQYYSNGEISEGKFLVYLGSATGLSALPAFQYEGGQTSAALGTSVAMGDLNGDGADDVIVGAELFDGGGFENEGAAFVYHGSPPQIGAPFSQLHASLPSLASGLNYSVDLGSLPGRPRLVVEVVPDAAHPDFVYKTGIACSVQGAGSCNQLDHSQVTGSGPQNAYYDVFLCQPAPDYTGHTCNVTIRPISFGSAGAPATVDVTIRGETRVPTGTVEVEIDATSNPTFSGIANVGTMPFFNEGQNFRWIYDLDADNVLFTPVEGRCEALNPASASPFHNYTYEFQGAPTYQGLDCCTWQIGSTTGVTGTGQALFYINTSSSNPAFQPGDADIDGIKDLCDNCPNVPNGPLRGTCTSGSRTGNTCRSNQECLDGPCSLAQDDLDRNGVGNVCVPEPGQGALLAIGWVGLAALVRRHRKDAQLRC